MKRRQRKMRRCSEAVVSNKRGREGGVQGQDEKKIWSGGSRLVTDGYK